MSAGKQQRGKLPTLNMDRIRRDTNELSVIQRILPGGKLNGDEYTALNPTRPDTHTGSLKYNIGNERWADFAEQGATGFGAVTLYAYLKNIQPVNPRMRTPEAAFRLIHELGFSVNAYVVGGNAKPWLERLGLNGVRRAERIKSTPDAVRVSPSPPADSGEAGAPADSGAAGGSADEATPPGEAGAPPTPAPAPAPAPAPQGKKEQQKGSTRFDKTGMNQGRWYWLGPVDPETVVPFAPLYRYPGKENAQICRTAIYEYRDAAGKLVLYQVRYDGVESDGKPGKRFTPYQYREHRETGEKAWIAGMERGLITPLFGLPNVLAQPDALVIVHEGEKAALAGQQWFPGYAHVASLNGARSPAGTDWKPIAGRRVVMVPDADEAGAGYAGAVAGLIHQAGGDGQYQCRATVWAGLGETHSAIVARIVARKGKAEGADFADLCELIEATAEGEARDALMAKVTAWIESAESLAAPAGDSTGNGIIPGADDRPCYRVFDDWIEAEERKFKPGVHYFGRKIGQNKEVTLYDAYVCAPLHVEAITRDGQNNNFGRLLRFVNSLGGWRVWSMPMEMLKGSAEELRGELLAMGLELDPHYAKQYLGPYLQSVHPDRSLFCALQTGWASTKLNAFVLPDGAIGPGAADVVFQSGERYYDEYRQTGTLESWQSGISLKAVNNPVLTLSLSAAFVGPLLARCCAESGGVHYVGDSSIGKTTVLIAACSVWGGSGFKRSWRATANGMEGAAAMFNDCLLALDEISECDPREIGNIIYALGNGGGKQRASRTGSARSVTRWRCFILSTGERTIGTAMAEGGHKAKAGQSVRLLDVPLNRAFGAWDDLHEAQSAAHFADDLKRESAESYGVAGRSFLENLTRDNRDFTEMLEGVKALPGFAVVSKDGSDGSDGQLKRAAARFALIGMAGELASQYGVTGWPDGAAAAAAAEMFGAWREMRGERQQGSGNDERRQLAEALNDFIEQHTDSRFSCIRESEVTGDLVARTTLYNRAGWYRDTQTRLEGEVVGWREYLFTAAGLREALKGFDFHRSLKALVEMKVVLGPGPDGKTARLLRPDGKLTRLYLVNPDKLRGFVD